MTDLAAGTPRIEHRYEPRGACRALFHRRDPELLIAGPAGTGKSRACLEKLHAVMLANPGARGLIVRKTQVSLASSALVTYAKFVAVEAIATGAVRFFGGNAQEPPQYRYSNGSTVAIAGMDRATKVMSTEYDMIYVQEAIELTLNDWEALGTRLRYGRVSFQQLLADTNPDADSHWLIQRVNNGDTSMLESRHSDNPRLYNADGIPTEEGARYMARLDALTGVRRYRLKDGLWVAAEGIIFDQWDPAIHLIDPFPIPDEWPRYWVVDFGYTNPFVLQWWAVDPDGRLHRYREIYMTRRLVEDHARDALKIVAPEGTWIEPEPVTVICDHDAEDRATLERHLGFGTSPAHKSVSDGLQATAARFRVAGDGQPRIYFHREALVEKDPDLVEAVLPTCTEEEIGSYVWADSKTKEQPRKENDHGCDTTRYMVAERDLGGRPNVRFL